MAVNLMLLKEFIIYSLIIFVGDITQKGYDKKRMRLVEPYLTKAVPGEYHYDGPR